MIANYCQCFDLLAGEIINNESWCRWNNYSVQDNSVWMQISCPVNPWLLSGSGGWLETQLCVYKQELFYSIVKCNLCHIACEGVSKIHNENKVPANLLVLSLSLVKIGVSESDPNHCQ